jgi:hypothetical protein
MNFCFLPVLAIEFVSEKVVVNIELTNTNVTQAMTVEQTGKP